MKGKFKGILITLFFIIWFYLHSHAINTKCNIEFLGNGREETAGKLDQVKLIWMGFTMVKIPLKSICWYCNNNTEMRMRRHIIQYLCRIFHVQTINTYMERITNIYWWWNGPFFFYPLSPSNFRLNLKLFRWHSYIQCKIISDVSFPLVEMEWSRISENLLGLSFFSFSTTFFLRSCSFVDQKLLWKRKMIKNVEG